jgi:rhodanese-related sulfurtransferase
MKKQAPSYVLEFGVASPAAATRHFAAKLAVECDPWDVYNDMQNKAKDFVLVDARNDELFAREHIPGAIHFWHRAMNAASVKRLPKTKVIVLYCTGTGCNAAPKAALKLSRLGFRVKEMTGGIVWWKERFGYPVISRDGD